MKKILAVILAGASVAAFADTFQDFNNNLYAQYQFVSPNQGSAGGNFSEYGIGGTFQSKNNVWVNADVASGTASFNSIGNGQGNSISLTNGGTNITNTNLDLKAGYAFQFFNNEDNGLQIIPYASFSSGTYTGTGYTAADGTAYQGGTATYYTYGVGGKVEYRLLNSLKVALDGNIYGVQQGNSAYTSSGQNFGYAITPGVQYDISKTVLVGVDYSYSNSFNSNGSTLGSNGNSTVTAKVGYLF